MKPVFLNQEFEKEFQKEEYFISIFEKLHFNTLIDNQHLSDSFFSKSVDIFN